MLGFDDFTDGGADHDLTDHGAGGVGLAVVHAAAHVGIEREVVMTHEHLTVGQRRDRRLDDREVRRGRFTGGAGGQQDLRVGHSRSIRARSPSPCMGFRRSRAR